MQPLFSIIIPSYNSEKVIGKAIESVLSQTFSRFEILILDGCSSDATEMIVQAYDDHRIKFFSEPDRGIYDAMNKGVKKAIGEWVYFMGSDDTLFSKDTLERMVSFFDDNEVVYGNVSSSRFGGLYDGEFVGDKILKQNICHQAIFFKKIIFKKVGNFDLKYKAHADWDHNLKWFFSKDVKKQYVNVTIADYADGGFSSNSKDDSFNKIKNWKFKLLNKDKIDFREKLVIVKTEIFKALKLKRKHQIIHIIIRIPYFLM